jgi:hypothetical protein
MKLTPNVYKIKDGLVTKVFDPLRHQFHEDNAIIDLDTLSLDVQMYYQRIFAEGDLVEYVEKPATKQTTKPNGDN